MAVEINPELQHVPDSISTPSRRTEEDRRQVDALEESMLEDMANVADDLETRGLWPQARERTRKTSVVTPHPSTDQPMAEVEISTSDAPLSRREQNVEKLISALYGHPRILAWEITIARERDYRKLTPRQRRGMNCTFHSLVMSTHFKVLRAIIEGNLALAEIVDPEVEKELKYLQRNPHGMPVIYMFSLVNSQTGEAPSPSQIRSMVGIARQYHKKDVTDDATLRMIRSIDNYMTTGWKMLGVPNAAKNNARRYFGCDNGDWSTKQDKIKSHLEFLDDLHQRASVHIGLPSDDEPMSAALQEVGYAFDYKAGLTEHRKRSSTNDLMKLFETICDIAWPDSYRLVPHIIFHCHHYSHAFLGEIFFSRLGQSYIDAGPGFNTVAAGDSYQSIKNISNEQWNIWESLLVKETSRRIKIYNEELKKNRKESEDHRRLQEDLLFWQRSAEGRQDLNQLIDSANEVSWQMVEEEVSMLETSLNKAEAVTSEMINLATSVEGTLGKARRIKEDIQRKTKELQEERIRLREEAIKDQEILDRYKKQDEEEELQFQANREKIEAAARQLGLRDTNDL